MGPVVSSDRTTSRKGLRKILGSTSDRSEGGNKYSTAALAFTITSAHPDKQASTKAANHTCTAQWHTQEHTHVGANTLKS